jgi:hypothetical protein
VIVELVVRLVNKVWSVRKGQLARKERRVMPAKLEPKVQPAILDTEVLLGLKDHAETPVFPAERDHADTRVPQDHLDLLVHPVFLVQLVLLENLDYWVLPVILV